MHFAAVLIFRRNTETRRDVKGETERGKAANPERPQRAERVQQPQKGVTFLSVNMTMSTVGDSDYNWLKDENMTAQMERFPISLALLHIPNWQKANHSKRTNQTFCF